MQVPPHAAKVGQPKHNSSPLTGDQSAFNYPPIRSPASYLSSRYSGTGMLRNSNHPHFHGALRNQSWPVAQPFFMPIERSETVHFYQGCHYQSSVCDMSHYNCCTHNCFPAGHYRHRKRPQIYGEKLLTTTERVTSQIPQTNRTTPCNSLPPGTCVEHYLHPKRARKDGDKLLTTAENSIVTYGRRVTSQTSQTNPTTPCNLLPTPPAAGHYPHQNRYRIDEHKLLTATESRIATPGESVTSQTSQINRTSLCSSLSSPPSVDYYPNPKRTNIDEHKSLRATQSGIVMSGEKVTSQTQTNRTTRYNLLPAPPFADSYTRPRRTQIDGGELLATPTQSGNAAPGEILSSKISRTNQTAPCNSLPSPSSADHFPQPKRTQIDGGKSLTTTESGTATRGQRVTSQTSPTNRTTPFNSLPSPPPLITKCKIGFDRKKATQPHFEEQVENKLHPRGRSSKKHSTSSRKSSKVEDGLTKTILVDSSTTCHEPSKDEIDNKRNTNSHQKKKTSHELNKCDSSSPDNNLDAKSISWNDVHKDCVDFLDSYNWCEHSNTPDEELKPCISRSVGHLGHCYPQKSLKDCRHCMATQDDARQDCQQPLFGIPQRDNAMIRNDSQMARAGHSCDENAPQKDVNQRSQAAPLKQQQPLSNTPTDYREKEANPCNDKTATRNDNTNHPAMSTTEHRKWNTKISRDRQHQQFTHMPNNGIHPQLQFYPAPNVKAMLQRFRSKSCDDTPNSHTVKSPASGYKPQPDVSTDKAQMQNEKPREQDLKNQLVEYDGVQTCSSTTRRYQRSKSMFCDRPQNSHSIDNNTSEMPSVSNCYKQTDKMVCYQSVPSDNSKTCLSRLAHERQVRGQTAAMKERRTQQQSDISSRSDNSMPPDQDNHLFLSDTTRMPMHRDQNRMGALTHDNNLCRDYCQKSSSTVKHERTTGRTVCQSQSSLTPCNSSLIVSGPTSLNELQKRRTERHTKSKDPPFDMNEQKDVSRTRNQPNDVQMSQYQELKKESIHDYCKLSDIKRLKGHQKPSEGMCGTHRSPGMRGFSDKSSHSQEPAEDPNGTNVESNNHSLETLTTNHIEEDYDSNIVKNKISNYQEADTLQSQATCSSLRTLPPLPSGTDLDNMDTGCGGYAIDHNALPRIVAVHSIVTQDEAMKEDESSVFSASDKKYWNDLLHKLTVDMQGDSEFQQSKPDKILQVSHSQPDFIKELQENAVEDDKDVTLKKDSITQQESSKDGNLFNNIEKWAMWRYLSSPSKELTIEIKSPTEFVEVVETEKKPQSLSRKLSVTELSEKILFTRERIRNEEIPWKKKLLFSLEATFIKRLRKTEKQTGVKADILINEDKPNDESKERKSGEREKCNKQDRKKKIATKAFKKTRKERQETH